MRLKLTLQYDGTPFHGWQMQPNVPSVCGELVNAFQLLTQEAVEPVAAGRTDAGVHAWGQVVHVDVTKRMPPVKFLGGLNRFLPPTVRVTRVAEVSEDFHARYSATARHYRYVLWVGRQLRPDLLGHAGHVRHPLNVAAMQEALRRMGTGEMDFSGFRDAECQSKTPLCNLHEARLTLPEPTNPQLPTSDSPFSGLLWFEVAADHFLHHMVRNMVGTLVEVGLGKRGVTAMADVLASRDRRTAAMTFAPDGLYFIRVDYSPHTETDPTGD